jgi:hypothetical protein
VVASSLVFDPETREQGKQLLMTLEELADQLPNGFHDMSVRSMTLDFVRRTATFDVDLCVGNADAESPLEHDAYRSAQLVLEELAFCVIDPPDPRYPFAKSEPAWFVDLFNPAPDHKALESLSPDTFAGRFFVNQWNAYVHVAAKHARVQWDSERIIEPGA